MKNREWKELRAQRNDFSHLSFLSITDTDDCEFVKGTNSYVYCECDPSRLGKSDENLLFSATPDAICVQSLSDNSGGDDDDDDVSQ